MTSEYPCGDKKEHESWTKHSQPWPCPRCTAIEHQRRATETRQLFVRKYGETGEVVLKAISELRIKAITV